MSGKGHAGGGPSVESAATARLADWMRRRRLLLGLAVAVAGLLAAVNAMYPLGRDANIMVLLAMGCCLGLPGLILQFRERCPGCGARLGWQTGLRLPAACRRCATPLGRGPGR